MIEKSAFIISDLTLAPFLLCDRVATGTYARVGGDYLAVRNRTYLLLSQRFNLAHQTHQLLSCHLLQRLSGSDRLY